MSFTCTVLYQNSAKKIQCPSSFTVNQLAQLSLDKFRLSDCFGELSHSGKKLDPLLPIRLTNLVNNAKLALSISTAEIVASLKVVGIVDLIQHTCMLKLPSSAPIAELVLKFAALNNLEIDLSSKRVSVTVLQSAVNNSTTDLETVLLKSLLGNSSSAMIRLVIEDKEVHEHKKRLKDEETFARLKMEEEKNNARMVQKEKKLAQEALTKNEPTQDSRSSSEHKEAENLAEDDQIHAYKERDESGMSSNIESATQAKQIPARETQKSETKPYILNTDQDDAVYVSLGRTQIYENPEDDYDMTTSQAEKYLGLLKSMQTRKKVQRTAVKPKSYTIRLRFPNRSILQLHMEDSSVKLGQLLKKIDSFVNPKFLNSYRLKSGSPPFSEIQFDFDANAKPMNEHPAFQEEKILLIWEATIACRLESYLKEGLSTKGVDQLSTMKLEAHRGQLEDDEKISKDSQPKESKGQPKSKAHPGMPKWFRQ